MIIRSSRFVLLRYLSSVSSVKMAINQQTTEFVHHNTSDDTALSNCILQLRKLFLEEGINSLNSKKFLHIIQNSDIQEKDYSKYTRWIHKGYARNLIDQANGSFNLMTICWSPGSCSPIHSHAGAHCIVRLLSGTIQESIYTKPANDATCSEPLNLQVTRSLTEGDTVYLRDDIGVHRMENNSDEGAITLHLYSPPYDVTDVFDEESGARKDAEIMYVSKGGVDISQNNTIPGM